MLYSDFVQKERNTETGVAHYFDVGYYNDDSRGSDSLPLPTAKNKLLTTLHSDIMCLTAYGVQPAIIYKILCSWKPELKNVARGAFSPYHDRCCTYYSTRIDELKKVIGSFEARSEQLIDIYLNTSKQNSDAGKLETYLDTPVDINSAERDIKIMLQKLLMYTGVSIPDELNIKKLNTEEKQIKENINNCEDLSIMNEYYAQLVNVLSQKQEYRKNYKNANQYKAIRCLKSCGFIDSAYRWLNCFPDKM